MRPFDSACPSTHSLRSFAQGRRLTRYARSLRAGETEGRRARHERRALRLGLRPRSGHSTLLACHERTWRFAEGEVRDAEKPAMSEPGGSPKAKRQVSRMEAAGVEPASERPVATGLYMRSRTLGFATGVEERRNRRPLARLNLVGAHRTDAPTSLLNGVRPQPVGWKRRTSRGFKPRVQAASSQLRLFAHRFYERDGRARHASSSPLPPSKPDRPHKARLIDTD